MLKSFTILILIFSFYSYAEKEWPNTSGMYMSLKSNEEYLKHREELPLLMEELYKKLAVDYYISEVKQYTKIWETYIDSACGILGTSTGGSNGWPGHFADECKIKLMIEKKSNIRKAIECIENLTRGRLSEGAAERMECLVSTLDVNIKKI